MVRFCETHMAEALGEETLCCFENREHCAICLRDAEIEQLKAAIGTPEVYASVVSAVMEEENEKLKAEVSSQARLLRQIVEASDNFVEYAKEHPIMLRDPLSLREKFFSLIDKAREAR